MLIALALLAAAYLIGSIPFGYLLARSRGIDIRKHGSGNIGATNVWRVMGRKYGLPCFILDVLKGLLPSASCGFLLAGPLHDSFTPTQAISLQLGVAVAAILGHMFPVWLKFKGGKGVATSFGALLGVWPVFTAATLVALLVWIVCAKATKMVGISSCIAAVALVAVVLLETLAPQAGLVVNVLRRAPSSTWIHAGFAIALGILVIYKHRSNIARTIAGTENRIGQPRKT